MINKELLSTLLKEATAVDIDINALLAECLQDVRDYADAKEAVKEFEQNPRTYTLDEIMKEFDME